MSRCLVSPRPAGGAAAQTSAGRAEAVWTSTSQSSSSAAADPVWPAAHPQRGRGPAARGAGLHKTSLGSSLKEKPKREKDRKIQIEEERKAKMEAKKERKRSRNYPNYFHLGPDQKNLTDPGH